MCIDAKMPTESKCKANENASMNSVQFIRCFGNERMSHANCKTL